MANTVVVRNNGLVYDAGTFRYLGPEAVYFAAHPEDRPDPEAITGNTITNNTITGGESEVVVEASEYEQTAQDEYEAMTVPDLRKLLKDAEVDFPRRALKDDLVAIAAQEIG